MFEVLKRACVAAAILGCGVSLGACSDDDDNGGGDSRRNISFGVDGDKQAKDLSEAEIERACDAIEAYGEEIITEEEELRFGCTFAGLFVAGFSEPSTDEELQMACAETRDMCIAEGPQEDPMDMPEVSSCEFDEIAESCTATVEELEDCSAAQVEIAVEALEQFTCEGLSLSDDLGAAEPQELPAACQSVAQKCPELFESDSEDGE